MRFYKDVDRMADIFVLDDGNQYLLRWVDQINMIQQEKDRLRKRENIKDLLEKYGRRI